MLKIIAVSIIILLAVLLIATGIAGHYMYRFATVRRREKNNYWAKDTPLPKPENLSDEDYAEMNAGAEYIKSREYETVQIVSHDSLKLYGRLFQTDVNPRRGIFIMVHGYRSTPIYDFSCAVQEILEMDFSCLLIDQRACGLSEGRHIGFGVLERRDLIKWCEYLQRRYPNLPVVLDGISMGSATVMMGCGIGYPDNVRALICDCGYTTAGEICRITLKRWFKLPPFPVYYAAAIFVRIFAHYDLDSISSADCLKRNVLPILIVHGKADGFVPYRMSEENIKACAEPHRYAVLLTSEIAEHGQTLLRNRAEYVNAIHDILEKAGI